MKYYVFILIAFGALVGCNKENSDDNCIEHEIAHLTSVNAPSTGVVNEAVEIEVNFNIKNSCGSFIGFEESNNGNSRTIKVNNKYEGCICMEVLEMKTVIYTFKAVGAGEYELKFMSGEDDYIAVVITIT